MVPTGPEGDPFVGRERELQQLDARLALAWSGRGGLVLLVGEPGIGKSRTAEEVVVRAGLPEHCVLWGRCTEHEGAPPYWPWVQALRTHAARGDAADLAHDLGPTAAELASIVPNVRRRLPHLPAPEKLEPAQARFRVFDAVGEWLRRSAARDPLLLILNDLHWADQDSLLLLEHIAREARSARLLLLGTYREAEMMRRTGLLGPLARASERILLRGLDRGGVEAFVRGSGVTPTPERVTELLQTSDGNPFFLSELLRMLCVEAAAGPGASAPRE